MVLQINTVSACPGGRLNMNNFGLLSVYCLLVLVASMLGGIIPYKQGITHSRLQFYLSLSAGVMLGASFFHVMPEAMERSGALFGWWMSLGAVGLFCIERFIAPHSHEVNGHHNHEHHGHSHDHHHGHDHAGEPKAAAPAVAGWMAVIGLTIHTFMNGVGLAGQVQLESQHPGSGWLPGFTVFLAIVLHKPFDALAISTVLSRKHISRQLVSLVQLGFALMVPVGVIAFNATSGAIEAGLQSQLTGAALSFSAGTFLFIALSDLLPEVQFHTHDRGWLFLALLLGVVGMGGIAALEDHDHGDEHSHTAPADVHDHHQDGDHDDSPDGEHAR
jgi:zinc and cadmium transporter